MIEPTVSLVMTAAQPGSACIDSLAAWRQAADDGLEAIIVTRQAGIDVPAIARAFPGARVIQMSGSTTIPEMRAAGVRAARGDIVALATDRCRPGEGWLGAVREAHRRGAAVVGGPILFESDRLVDWAVVFCEYGRFLPPMRAGPTSNLAAHNVSYGRPALAAIDDLLPRGLWETFWHHRLQERGIDLVCEPAVTILFNRRYTLGGFIRQRFHFAKSFAAQRVEDRPWPVRLTRAAGSALLPGLLMVRLMRHLLPKRRYRGLLFRAVPVLAVFSTVWAAGECAGYLAGGGNSGQRID